MFKRLLAFLSLLFMLLAAYLFVPPLYISYEVDSYLNRLARDAGSLNNTEIRKRVDKFMNELGRNFRSVNLDIQRSSQVAKLSIEYTDLISLGLLGKKIPWRFSKEASFSELDTAS